MTLALACAPRPCLGVQGAAEEPAPGADPPMASELDETGAPTAERPDIIKSIEFEGNVKFKDHVLRQRLGFELGDRLDPFLAEGGRITIAEVYEKIGFPFVEVTLDRDRMAQGHLLYGIDEGARVQIASIRFVGNEAMKSGTLKGVIKTTKKKWLLWPFYYTEEAIAEDVDRLREFYYDRGYLDYEIKAETEFTADGAGIDVTFIIDEGPVYRIGSLALTGHRHFTTEQLREVMELAAGDVYLRPQAVRDAREIARLYQEQGFVDVVVRQRPKFTTQTGANLIALEFEIEEGRQFRIGRIEITGNETTQDKVIRRILDEHEFTPGNWYNAQLAPKQGGGLLEMYSQYATAAQEVLIRPVDPPDGDPNRKDVRVSMKEGMSGMIIPGVGISSDSGVVGRLVFRQQNFDISDLPESWGEFLSMKSFRGAGQSLSLTLEPGTQYSQYYVSFTDPYWRDRPIEFNLLGRSWERWRESYDEERLKGAFSFEQRLRNRWRRSLGFRAENVNVGNLDSDAPQEIRDVQGGNQLYGVRFGLGETTLDNRHLPSRGHIINSFYEQVTGDHAFGVLEGTYVRYFTLYEDVLERKTVLAGKVLGATVLGSAPPFEKFYAGGTGHYGMRGFEYRGVSTRGLQTNVPDPQLKDPIGSDWIFLANAEITVPLVGENFAGLFFVDSGTIDTGSYRVSIGMGIQIMVPQIFGNIPMRFEIATPLLRDDLDETQVFSFSGAGMF